MRKLKLVTTLLSTVMIFSLVACGGSNTASNQKTQAATESKAVAEAKTEAIKETAAKETTKPTTVAPTQESTTKQQDDLEYHEYVIQFDQVYISQETCKKIYDTINGICIKKGDTLDIGAIGFSGEETVAKDVIKSTIANIILSGVSPDTDILEARTKRIRNFKIEYDANKLVIFYT